MQHAAVPIDLADEKMSERPLRLGPKVCGACSVVVVVVVGGGDLPFFVNELMVNETNLANAI